MVSSFLRYLLQNDAFGAYEDIDATAAALSLQTDAKQYLCVTINRERRKDCALASITESGRILDSCTAYCQSLPKSAWTTLLDSGECVVILLDPGDMQAVERTVKGLYKRLHKEKLSPVVIAVGQYVEKMAQLRGSYLSARNAWLRRLPECQEGIVFSSDVIEIRRASTLQPLSLFEDLIRLFQENDLAGLRSMITREAEKVRMRSQVIPGEIYPTSIKRMFTEMTVHVLHAASDTGVDVDQLLFQADPYTAVMNTRSTPMLIEQFLALCERLNQAVACKLTVNENTIIQKACAYIDAHIAEYDLSLDSVSKYLSITSTYLSKLFHQEMGKLFSAYLIDKRMNIAQELLEKTDLKISVIAREAGFSTAQYFCTTFRKQFGVTPTVFRQRGPGSGD